MWQNQFEIMEMKTNSNQTVSFGIHDSNKSHIFETEPTFSFHQQVRHLVHPDHVVYFLLVLRPLRATLVESASVQSYCCGTVLDFRTYIWYFVIRLLLPVILNWLMLFLRQLVWHLLSNEDDEEFSVKIDLVRVCLGWVFWFFFLDLFMVIYTRRTHTHFSNEQWYKRKGK